MMCGWDEQGDFTRDSDRECSAFGWHGSCGDVGNRMGVQRLSYYHRDILWRQWQLRRARRSGRLVAFLAVILLVAASVPTAVGQRGVRNGQAVHEVRGEDRVHGAASHLVNGLHESTVLAARTHVALVLLENGAEGQWAVENLAEVIVEILCNTPPAEWGTWANDAGVRVQHVLAVLGSDECGRRTVVTPTWIHWGQDDKVESEPADDYMLALKAATMSAASAAAAVTSESERVVGGVRVATACVQQLIIVVSKDVAATVRARFKRGETVTEEHELLLRLVAQEVHVFRGRPVWRLHVRRRSGRQTSPDPDHDGSSMWLRDGLTGLSNAALERMMQLSAMYRHVASVSSVEASFAIGQEATVAKLATNLSSEIRACSAHGRLEEADCRDTVLYLVDAACNSQLTDYAGSVLDDEVNGHMIYRQVGRVRPSRTLHHWVRCGCFPPWWRYAVHCCWLYMGGILSCDSVHDLL